MKILTLSIPRESECTLPDGSSYAMYISRPLAGLEKDLRNLGHFLFVFFYP